MATINILACQAQTINHYKNVRTKVLKCCANICFNRQCLIKKAIPKYANIHISGHKHHRKKDTYNQTER